MRVSKISNCWGGIGGIIPPVNQYNLLRFALKYRTSDYAYETTTVYSDYPTISANIGLIRVETKAIDGVGFSNSLTTPVFIAAEDVDDSQVMAIQGDSPRLRIWDLPWTTVTDSIAVFGQSALYDAENDRIGNFNNPNLSWYDRAGTLIETLTTPTITGSSSTKVFYDYTTGKYYVSPSNSPSDILVWVRSGSALVLSETLSIESIEGIALDFARGLLVSSNNSKLDNRVQALSGIKNISIKSTPIYNNEGIACFPDGTFLYADPAGFHASIVGGNRMWWVDPHKLHKKYERSPAMTRFSKFTGGTLSGIIEGQKITQSVAGKIYSPVYDTNGFTNTENTDAWEFEFSDGGDADIAFICSDTAPTTTPTTNYFSDIPVYAGWGSTIPDAESGTPGTKRYKQAVLTVKESTSTLITVEQILATLGSKCKIFTYDGDRSRTYATPSLGENALVLLNLANPNNNLVQSTNTLRFTYSDVNEWMDDTATNNNYELEDISVLSGDTQGQVINVVRGKTTTGRRVWFGLSNDASNNNRLYAYQNGSSNAINNQHVFQRINGAGTAAQTCSYIDSDFVFKRWDFICDGADWIIKRDNIEVSRTVGANEWFAACTGANNFKVGVAEGASVISGTHVQRLFIYCSSPLSTEENDLIQDFIVQEGLI